MSWEDAERHLREDRKRREKERTAKVLADAKARVDAGVRRIGSVCVDSGQVMVVDPCYVDEFKPQNLDELFEEGGDGTKAQPFSYTGACNVTLGKWRAGSLGRGDNPLDLAVASETGVGDGLFDVYVEYNADSRVRRLIVDFDGSYRGQVEGHEDEED